MLLCSYYVAIKSLLCYYYAAINFKSILCCYYVAIIRIPSKHSTVYIHYTLYPTWVYITI